MTEAKAGMKRHSKMQRFSVRSMKKRIKLLRPVIKPLRFKRRREERLKCAISAGFPTGSNICCAKEFKREQNPLIVYINVTRLLEEHSENLILFLATGIFQSTLSLPGQCFGIYFKLL